MKDLNGFFHPKGIAVIGASANEQKIGYQILRNLIAGGFGGDIFPVNPKDERILNLKAYKTVREIPGAVDLAIIAIPAPLVVSAMQECAQKKVSCVAVITSGFGEVGNVEAEERLKEICDEHHMAMIGPNILGLLYTPSKINASFGPKDILNGKIAFISQSGALAISLMGWTVMEKIGLASLVSLGNKADVGERELIEYFNHDENVNVILIYMEGLKDGRQFMLTEIKKPVVVLKVGRSQRGAKAAASHTGSLTGSDKIFEAAFKQLGILRARSFTEAFDWARAFSLPLPYGEETVIITNGGGIGVSATDECEAAGIKLLDSPAWLEEKFRCTMPDFGSTKNPIDITGQGHQEEYQRATRIALGEDKIHAVIILYCETAVTDPMAIARGIEQEYTASGRIKPFVVAMVGGERARDAIHFLNEKNIPSFGSVEGAISVLKVLDTWKQISARSRERVSVETPAQEALDIIEKAKSENRGVLLEPEARRVLEICGVPLPKGGFAKDLEEAIKKAEGLYPLAMKITSPDIIHKSDVGGVVVNIRNPEELKDKYQRMMERVSRKVPDAELLGVTLVQMVQGIECIVGLTHDPQFGSVVMFGLGGVFVEALKDVSFRIVPFGKTEAQRLMRDIQAKKILDGFRGMKAHKASIVETLCAVQKLSSVVKEVDINPLVTNADGSFAVDARIIL